MARYYHTRQATSSFLTSEAQHQVITLRDASHRYPDSDNALASSSVLVFPNPPSERESFRDESHYEFTGSTPSLPTDVSLDSSRSRSRSRDKQFENERSWHDISQTSSAPRNDSSPEEEWEAEFGGEDLKNRWDDARYNSNRNRPIGLHTRTTSNLSSLSGVAPSISPDPPFRLPLLSCLQTFLSLEESTLHLLSRSPTPHASVLFPFSPGSTPSLPEGSQEEPAHGVHKLLLENPDKPKNGVLFRADMESHEDSTDAHPPLLIPVRIPVWQFLEFVIEGGLRAWRRAHGGEARLVGV